VRAVRRCFRVRVLGPLGSILVWQEQQISGTSIYVVFWVIKFQHFGHTLATPLPHRPQGSISIFWSTKLCTLLQRNDIYDFQLERPISDHYLWRWSSALQRHAEYWRPRKRNLPAVWPLRRRRVTRVRQNIPNSLARRLNP
jgi:hypothetical protein